MAAPLIPILTHGLMHVGEHLVMHVAAHASSHLVDEVIGGKHSDAHEDEPSSAVHGAKGSMSLNMSMRQDSRAKSAPRLRPAKNPSIILTKEGLAGAGLVEGSSLPMALLSDEQMGPTSGSSTPGMGSTLRLRKPPSRHPSARSSTQEDAAKVEENNAKRRMADREKLANDRERALADRERFIEERERAVTARERAQPMGPRERAVTDRERAAADRERALADREARLAERERVAQQSSQPGYDKSLDTREKQAEQRERLALERERVLSERERALDARADGGDGMGWAAPDTPRSSVDAGGNYAPGSPHGSMHGSMFGGSTTQNAMGRISMDRGSMRRVGSDESLADSVFSERQSTTPRLSRLATGDNSGHQHSFDSRLDEMGNGDLITISPRLLSASPSTLAEMTAAAAAAVAANDAAVYGGSNHGSAAGASNAGGSSGGPPGSLLGSRRPSKQITVAVDSLTGSLPGSSPAPLETPMGTSVLSLALSQTTSRRLSVMLREPALLIDELMSDNPERSSSAMGQLQASGIVLPNRDRKLLDKALSAAPALPKRRAVRMPLKRTAPKVRVSFNDDITVHRTETDHPEDFRAGVPAPPSLRPPPEAPAREAAPEASPTGEDTMAPPTSLEAAKRQWARLGQALPRAAVATLMRRGSMDARRSMEAPMLVTSDAADGSITKPARTLERRGSTSAIQLSSSRSLPVPQLATIRERNGSIADGPGDSSNGACEAGAAEPATGEAMFAATVADAADTGFDATPLQSPMASGTHDRGHPSLDGWHVMPSVLPVSPPRP